MPASDGPTSSCAPPCDEDLPEDPPEPPEDPSGPLSDLSPAGLTVRALTVPTFAPRATFRPKSPSLQAFEELDDSACASAEDLGTVRDRRGQGLAAKARGDVRTRRIRGGATAAPGGSVAAPAAEGLEDLGAVAADVARRLGVARPATTWTSPGRPLADVIVLPRRVPELAFDPFTRALDGSGRLRVRIDGRSLTEVMGWATGPLTATTDGLWTVLRPDTDGGPLVRNDGRCSVTDDGRLRVRRFARQGKVWFSSVWREFLDENLKVVGSSVPEVDVSHDLADRYRLAINCSGDDENTGGWVRRT